MKKAVLIAGIMLSISLILLGGLWSAQGLGLIVIEPIACVGECAPLQGPSTTWTAVGALTLAAGAFGAAILWRRLRSDGANHAAQTQPGRLGLSVS